MSECIQQLPRDVAILTPYILFAVILILGARRLKDDS